MNFKKIFFCFIFLFTFIKCDEIDDAIDAATADADSSKETVRVKKDINYIDVLKQILALGINKILAKDLYRKTHPVLKRPVQTLPILNLYHTDHICQDWLFRLFLFGNSTDRAYFTNDSPLIKSFIALDDKDIVEILNDLIPNAPKVLELAKQAKKQERRGGLMFQSLVNFNDCSLEIDLPFFYEERNYFFTPREKEELEEVFGGRAEKDQEKELRKHAVSDKIGFGDARVKFGYSFIKDSNICFKAGLQSTLPISFVIKNGIMGSNFSKITKKQRPNLDLKRVFELIDTDRNELGVIFKDFGIAALDWMSAIVLDAPLGNGGHFGLGAFMEPQIRINEGITLKALGSIEYFFPNKEDRFFLKIKDRNAFKTSVLEKSVNNEEAAKKAVDFLVEQLIETVFPPVFPAEITPGFMAQITIGPQFKLNDWYFFFGYDFWFQDKEKIEYVFYNPCDLNLEKGTRGRAFSNKLFATLSYNKMNPNCDWAVMFSFEDAFSTKGIGRDFSVSVGFEINY